MRLQRFGRKRRQILLTLLFMFTLSIVNTVSAESNQGIDANSGPRINRESSLAFSAVQKRFLLKSMRASARGKHGRALYYIQKIKLSSKKQKNSIDTAALQESLQRQFRNLDTRDPSLWPPLPRYLLCNFKIV